MTLRALIVSCTALCAACGSQSAQPRAPTHAVVAEETCTAQISDAQAQAHAQAFERAKNILEYEAAWKRAYPSAAAGSIGAAEVRAVARAHTEDLRRCYESALSNVDSASGRVVVRFVIDPRGKVAAANLAQNDVGIPGVGCCVVRRLAAWSFPAPKEGSYAIVEYPFTVRLSH